MTGGPLLVLCALGPEAWALRGGDWAGGVGGPPVLVRTGIGRRRAGRSVRTVLARGGYGALVVAGFGASVAPGVRPGDVVVADAVRDTEGRQFGLDTARSMAKALQAHGLTTHIGLHHTADHVVRGAERQALHLRGALAVDMEAAGVLAARADTRPDLPAAVLRVVVDTPEHELLRPGTLPAGFRAWRTLRAAVPALTEWHRLAAAAVADQAGHADLAQSEPHPQPSTLPQEAS
ncbi:1-hydroxy-2-methyl-2-butenyl 4-diphosphate reductase [Kitasatospora paranensis]|uniref:1-hydroxy-2-methyl-2-butenyl 4-diphosphate reductase n=1 Tax=Kitasatospora paranensis TaxID=258053 RepID=A0ABW2FWP0_9ACTN